MHIAAMDGRGDEALPPQDEAVVISFLRLAQRHNPREHRIGRASEVVQKLREEDLDYTDVSTVVSHSNQQQKGEYLSRLSVLCS